jgi:hypothetical protein
MLPHIGWPAHPKGSQNGLSFSSMLDRLQVHRQKGPKVPNSETTLRRRPPNAADCRRRTNAPLREERDRHVPG